MVDHPKAKTGICRSLKDHSEEQGVVSAPSSPMDGSCAAPGPQRAAGREPFVDLQTSTQARGGAARVFRARADSQSTSFAHLKRLVRTGRALRAPNPWFPKSARSRYRSYHVPWSPRSCVVGTVEILALRVRPSGVVTADDEVGLAVVTAVPECATFRFSAWVTIRMARCPAAPWPWWVIGVVLHDRNRLAAAYARGKVRRRRAWSCRQPDGSAGLLGQLRGADGQFDVRGGAGSGSGRPPPCASPTCGTCDAGRSACSGAGEVCTGSSMPSPAPPRYTGPV